MCSGEQIWGILANGVTEADYQIEVPTGDTATISGTVYVNTWRDKTGDVISWDGNFYIGNQAGNSNYLNDYFDGSHGAGAYPFSVAWTGPTGQSVPFIVSAANYDTLGWDLTVKITGPTATTCDHAFHNGHIFGGSNSSEPWVCPCSVGAPVNTQDGSMWHTFSDLSLGGRGPALGLERTYNSGLGGVDGPFGYGWSASSDNKLTQDANGVVTFHQENGAASVFTPPSPANGTYSAPSGTDAVLTKNLGTGYYTLVRGKHDTLTFKPSGQIETYADPNGEALSYSYLPSAHDSNITLLHSITAGGGRSLTFDYETWEGGTYLDHVSKVTDQTNRFVSFTYVAGELRTATDVESNTTNFTYDVGMTGKHRLTIMQDPRLNSVTTHYDVADRVDWQKDRAQNETDFDYDVPGSPGATIVAGPRSGVQTRYVYSHGLLESRTDGYGSAIAATTKYVYDPVTLGPTKVTDPRNIDTTSEYDPQKLDLKKTTDRLGRVWSATYNDRHEPLVVDEPAFVPGSSTNHVKTTYAYDTQGRGNVTSVSRPLYDDSGNLIDTQVVAYTYNDGTHTGDDGLHPGDVTSIKDPRQKTASFAYDTQGNRIQTTDAMVPANVTKFATFTADGQPQLITSPLGTKNNDADASNHQTHLTYNNRGQLMSVVDARGNTTVTNHYDANGNRDWTKNAKPEQTTFQYDAEDRLKETDGYDGVVTKTDFYEDGLVKDQYDGFNKYTLYSYDELGRPSAIVNADDRNAGKSTSFSYNLTLHTRTVTDQKGRTTTESYDDADQLIAVNYSDSTPDVTSVEYDKTGRKTKMFLSGAPTADSTWKYDTLGRLQASTDPNGSIGYLHDIANNLTDITYPNNSVVHRDFDNNGRMSSSKDWNNNVTTFGYDEDGRLINSDLAGALKDEYGFNAAGQQEGATTFWNGTTAIASLTYTRYNTGDLWTETPTGLTGATAQTYGYTADRLTTANSQTWLFDAAGRIKQLSDGRRQGYTDGAQVCSTARSTLSTCASPTSDATVYGYDELGERTSMTPQVGTSFAYGYDQAQRLTSVSPVAYKAPTPAGWNHTLALRGDGTVQSFGLDDHGQLGDGTNVAGSSRKLPYTIAGLNNIAMTATGAYHSLAIDSSGNLYAWGLNNKGQLGRGDANYADHTTPGTKLSGISNVVAVAAGNSHTVALTADGIVYAWGGNDFGQLGRGGATDTNAHDVPQAVTALPLPHDVVAIAAGLNSSYAVRANGDLWAWGNNDHRQLGTANSAPSITTPTFTGITNIAEVSAGVYFAVARAKNGQVEAWGDNTYGQFGNGTTSTTPTATPVSNAITDAVRVVAGGFHALALHGTTTKTVASWGLNNAGQLGRGQTPTNPNAFSPGDIGGLSSITGIDAGNATSQAVDADGVVHTWGSDSYGQLGDGTTNTAYTPIVPDDGTETGLEPAGANHTLVLHTNKTLSAMGSNAFGQLGDGTTIDRTKPVAVAGLSNVTSSATGYYFSMALDGDGNVWTWGKDATGELGDRIASMPGANRDVPGRVYGPSHVTQIAAGAGHAVALDTSGTVWTWGQNDAGQLGYNGTTNSSTPTAVQGLPGAVSKIVAGLDTTYVLLTNYQVWGWGHGTKGELGGGATGSNSAVPVHIGSFTATDIQAGRFTGYALTSAGAVWAWGANDYGQIGNNSTSTLGVAPYQLTGPYAKIAAGDSHILAITTGTPVVKAWGRGGEGEIGDGLNQNQLVPKTINFPAGTANIATVDAGPLTSGAVTVNGDLFEWGFDQYGQIGDGNSGTGVKVSTPKPVTGQLDLDNTLLTTSFGYSADGLRKSKTYGDVTTKFAWDRDSNVANLLSETTGGQSTYYLYGPDGVAYEQVDPAGNVTYLHHDQIGSIRLVTDGSGVVVGSATYDPYGTKTSGSGTVPNIAWTGQYRDSETGLVYLRARYYDPATAQFLNRDPLEAVTREAYGYVGGNPLNETDPSGLFWGQGTLSNVGSAISNAAKNPIVQTVAVVGACTFTGPLGCAAVNTAVVAVNAMNRYEKEGGLTNDFWRGTIVDTGVALFNMNSLRSLNGTIELQNALGVPLLRAVIENGRGLPVGITIATLLRNLAFASGGTGVSWLYGQLASC